MGGSSSESQMLKIGLKFGQKVYFGDVGVGGEAKSESGSSPASGPGAGAGGGPQKKGRTEVGFQQPPRCQVEGCNLDLSDAKTYYSRHKVCGAHSKTPKVIVNGLEQRFCQQCSRFHLLLEFDQGKRSCRRRLAGHNERRRKPSLGTPLASRYASLPTIFESDTNSRGFLMDFSSYSRTRAPWPNPRAPPRATNEFPPLPWQSNLDNPPPYINGVQESSCALSLLSNHSSGSRTLAHTQTQTLSLEYYANPDACAPMVQPVAGTVVQGHFAPSMSAWGYDSGEAHVGLGQVVQSGYAGELGLGQNQGGKECDSSAEYVHWSL